MKQTNPHSESTNPNASLPALSPSEYIFGRYGRDQPRGRRRRDKESANRPSCRDGVHVQRLERGFGMVMDNGRVWNELIARCEDAQSVRRYGNIGPRCSHIWILLLQHRPNSPQARREFGGKIRRPSHQADGNGRHWRRVTVGISRGMPVQRTLTSHPRVARCWPLLSALPSPPLLLIPPPCSSLNC